MDQHIIVERDPFRGESYCIECFGPRNKQYFYFYNSQGPFCNIRCFADFLGVNYKDLPKVKFEGTVK